MKKLDAKTKKQLEKNVEQNLAKLRSFGLDTEYAPFQVDINLYKEFQMKKRANVKNPKYSSQYKANTKEQSLREKNILREYQACHGNDIVTKDWVNSHLSNADLEKLGQMLNGDFFDDATMNAMVCLANSAFLAHSSSLAANDRIRSWIRNLKQMGTESVAGFAMNGDVGSGIDEESTAKGAFIIKAIRDNERKDELIHEVFCGMKALNRLRKKVPNFAYIYGYLECSAPVGSVPTDNNPKGKKINTFCNTMGEGNDVVQAIYENISPAKDFGTVCETCDGQTYMRYYLATMMGLHVAEKEADFTHYDLHQENLLIRECTDTRFLESGKNYFYIPYTLELSNGKVVKYYVMSPGGIPTIIDYGRSHVNVDGRNYGMLGEDSYLYIQQNVYRDKCNPMYDAFKLLGMSLSGAYHSGNLKLVAEMAPLLRRFYVKDFDLFDLRSFSDLSIGFMMPWETTIEDMEQYIQYCISYCDAMGWQVVTKNPPAGEFILTPVSDRLELDILREIGLNEKMISIPQPQTFLELFDVLSKQAIIVNKYKGDPNRVNDAITTFRQVRSYFIQPDNLGSAPIAGAYDFVLRRMKEVCTDFFDANYFKVENLGLAIDNLEDIIPLINQVVKILNLPSNLNLYFDLKVLAQVKTYIAQIASFAEMRDTLSTIDKALEYIRTIYLADKDDSNVGDILPMLEDIHSYIHNFLDGIYPISQSYHDSLINFMDVFTETEENKYQYAKYKDLVQDYDYEEYGWYFNTVITVPSLFRN